MTRYQLLTEYSRILLDELIVPQTIKKFFVCMESKGSGNKRNFVRSILWILKSVASFQSFFKQSAKCMVPYDFCAF
jgi:hypothetical protein